MAVSFFGDKAVMPNDEMLEPVLKEAGSLWPAALEHARQVCEPVSGEWKF